MKVVDWRQAPAALMRALYSEEHLRWASQLGWNTTETWAEVEQARAAGRLAGLLAVPDDGDPADIRGWTYFLIEGGLLQVGGIVARSPEATRALLDALCSEARRAGVEGIGVFVYADAPGFEEALAARGFDVRRYRYLQRSPHVSNPLDIAPAGRWRADDVPRAAALLRAAYGANGVYFAPHGRVEEWERYVRNLVEYPACGHFDPAATRVLRDGDRLLGVVMVTALGPGVAHIAQVAVHPDARGRGVAGRLLDDAIAYATSQGLPRVTLLVDEQAEAPGALYARRGFEPVACFTAARRVSA